MVQVVVVVLVDPATRGQKPKMSNQEAILITVVTLVCLVFQVVVVLMVSVVLMAEMEHSPSFMNRRNTHQDMI